MSVLTESGIQLHPLLGFIAIEQHPQILNGWTITCIIQINKHWTIAPENIPGVAVSM